MRFEPFSSLHARAESRTLLCHEIRTPTIPQCRDSAMPNSVVWIQAEKPLSQHTPADVIELSERSAREAEQRSESAPSLFLSAHRLLAAGDPLLADRCIQKALISLASHSERSPDVSPAASWLVLATSSLLKSNWDSCETWLRQAERSLHQTENIDSALFRHAAGDLFAIQACLLSQTHHHEKAAKLLIEAFQCHLQAKSSASAAQDLILRSRLLIRERKWENAETILTQAERVTARGITNQDPDAARLQKIINRDRASIRDCCRIVRIAESN